MSEQWKWKTVGDPRCRKDHPSEAGAKPRGKVPNIDPVIFPCPRPFELNVEWDCPLIADRPNSPDGWN